MSGKVRIITALAFLMLPAMARGQAASDVEQLRAALEVQAALNRRLLERLDALEQRQAVTQSSLESLRASRATESADAENVVSMVEDLRSEYFALQDHLDALPALSGYYDFEYFNDDRADSPGEFRQHHVSLHLTREWEQWRLFTEVEFEFGTKFEGDGGLALEEARGEAKVEQAWGEYVHTDQLALRGGLILTPGYWNVNHYPNVVLSTRRPTMVREVFRESFVGLMAYGTKHWDDFGVTYHAYVGNGQSGYFTKHDDNEGKAVGGKLSFQLPTGGKFDSWDVGLNAYQESPAHDERVFAWGAETQLRHGPWELLAEFAIKHAADDATGLYVQPSYRFNPKCATFYRYDLLTKRHEGETQQHTLGVNFRPIPDVSLKLEYFYSRLSQGEDHSGVAASAAIHF